VARVVEARLADAIVATADDPRLESWLAFMGNCHAISLAHPQTPILNLDIGGGTTNLALGLGGGVVDFGCVVACARQFEFTPGTYTLTRLSSYAEQLLAALSINRHAGETLKSDEVSAIVDFYAGLIEAAACGEAESLATPLAKLHTQVAADWSKIAKLA